MDLRFLPFEWPWAFFIAATVANAVAIRVTSRRYVRDDPGLVPGYRTIVAGTLTWLNVPWVVMGAGMTVGGVPSVWHFFRPRDGDPWVLAFFGSVILLWALALYWVFLRGGAELLARHPFPGNRIRTPLGWKLFLLAGMGGGVLALVTMFVVDVPVREM